MLTRVVSKAGKRGFATYPAFVTNAPATEVSKTSNGVTVASEAAVGETATVKVWIDAGSRYESDRNIGSAKFLEHLAFKNAKSQTEIANLGGQVTAHTTRDRTVFSAKVFKGDVAKAVAVLADVVNAANDDAVIAREKEAFIKHHEKVHATFEEVTLDHLHTTAYMGTNLGRSIVGADANTKNLTKNDLTSYINNNWTANRVVVAGAGAIDHKQLTELSQTHFGGLKNGVAASEAAAPAIFTGSDKRVRYDSFGVSPQL
jgi:processing peptidase subunit beta